MKPTPVTAEYPIGKCPACDLPLIAAILVEPNLGAPVVRTSESDGTGTGPISVSMMASPIICGMAVNHMCGGAKYPVEVAAPDLNDDDGRRPA